MLELQKFVLQQVCDQKELFRKELYKSISWLKLEEVELLREWVVNQFGQKYNDVINEVFCVVET
jgi:hypothetical protein